jgi:ketosteroid isomerase-like protein
MSQKNVEVVLEGVRLFEASDLDGVERLWHPDGLITGPDGWPEPGPFAGRDAVIGQFRRLAADWGEQRVSDLRVVADRNGWVVLTYRWDVEGEKSGAATAATFAAAYRVEGGADERSAFPLDPRAGPRSRRAVGVGDVAGERGAGAAS